MATKAKSVKSKASFAFANQGLSHEQASSIWAALKKAIEEIQNGNASKLRFEELYRLVHRHCNDHKLSYPFLIQRTFPNHFNIIIVIVIVIMHHIYSLPYHHIV
jgi:hypothetical protein